VKVNAGADFFVEFTRTNRSFTNHTNRILEKHQLSSSFWRVMRILDKAAGKTFGEITDELQIEKPALTKIIKKLEAMNIVEISTGSDKREKIVVLTSTGKEILEQIRQELNPFIDHLLQGISDQELAQVKKVLQTIQQHMHTY